MIRFMALPLSLQFARNALAGVFLFALGTGHGLTAQAVVLALVGGRIVDGTVGPVLDNGCVLVTDGRISAVGRIGEVEVPQGARRIETGGCTVLPGIINAHVHEVANYRVLEEFLSSGVTSLAVPAAPLADVRFFVSHACFGGFPRVFWCGPMLTAPGGFPGPVLGRDLACEIQTSEAAKRAVAELATCGAHFIKVALEPGAPDSVLAGHGMPVLDLEVLRLIVEEAHRHKLIVRAHVTDSDQAWQALAAGVDTIEHLPLPFVPRGRYPEILAHADSVSYLFESVPRYDALLRAMASQGLILVPTLSSAAWACDKDRALPEERVFLAFCLEAVRRYCAAGGTVAVGNDFPEPGSENGIPLREMELLRKAGLSPLQVLVAATRNAAAASGQTGTLGTIETGKLADLIVVEGDPLTDLAALDHSVLVIKGGTIVAGTAP